jgi:hypothetical protein
VILPSTWPRAWNWFFVVDFHRITCALFTGKSRWPSMQRGLESVALAPPGTRDVRARRAKQNEVARSIGFPFDPAMRNPIRGFVNPRLRPPGVFSHHGVYREIVPERKLVVTFEWEGDDPVETLVTLEFLDREGGMELVLRQERFVDPEESALHAEGWSGSLRKIARYFG